MLLYGLKFSRFILSGKLLEILFKFRLNFDNISTMKLILFVFFFI